MSSSKLILFFIGIILIIVVILSSNKIGFFLRQKFGRFLPTNLAQLAKPTLTPTPKISTTPSPTMYNVNYENTTVNNKGTNADGNTYYTSSKGTNSKEIPATGPETILYVLLSGGFAGGLILNKFASKTKKSIQ